MPTGAEIRARPGALRWLTVGVAAYVGWLAANLVVLALMPLALVTEAFGGVAGRRFLRRSAVGFLKTFFLGYFRLIGVYRVAELPDQDRLAALRPCAFAANHRSWLDALLLSALIEGVRIPVNREYTRIPLAGKMMSWLGCISLDRHSRESIAGGVEEVRRLLAAGEPLAFFPEGTRSPIGTLRPFGGVFFRVVAEAGIPTVPVLVHLDHAFLGPKSENFLTPRGTVLRIRLLDPVEPEDGEGGADLARRVGKVMRTELARLDRGEVEPTSEAR
jgi:1-acyl-sn-glycerol-3-phosphate acyltransferase